MFFIILVISLIFIIICLAWNPNSIAISFSLLKLACIRCSSRPRVSTFAVKFMIYIISLISITILKYFLSISIFHTFNKNTLKLNSSIIMEINKFTITTSFSFFPLPFIYNTCHIYLFACTCLKPILPISNISSAIISNHCP